MTPFNKAQFLSLGIYVVAWIFLVATKWPIPSDAAFLIGFLIAWNGLIFGQMLFKQTSNP